MNLKEIAKVRGTNLKKLAEKCDVPASTLYAISCGDTNFEKVGIGLFMKLAKALDMTSDELYAMRPSVDYAMVELPEQQPKDEAELLEYYKGMDDERKEHLLNLAQGFYSWSIFDKGGHEAAREHGFDFVKVELSSDEGDAQ